MRWVLCLSVLLSPSVIGGGLIPLRERPVRLFSLTEPTIMPVLASQELSRINSLRRVELIIDQTASVNRGLVLGFETDRGFYLVSVLRNELRHGDRMIEVALLSEHPRIGLGLPLSAVIVRLQTTLQPLPTAVVSGKVIEKAQTKDGKWRITLETDHEPPGRPGLPVVIEHARSSRQLAGPSGPSAQ